MPLVSDDSVILQAFPYSETSKILRLLTRGHGVVPVMVRGARRPRSRYGGLLEPFTEGMASIHMKENRELQTLSGFDLVRSGQRLGADLVRFGGASLLAELVLHTGSTEPDSALFERIRDSLRDLADAPAQGVEFLLLARLWGLIAHLGFSPVLDHCLRCGRDLGPGEEAFFEYGGGGVRCADCPGPADGRPIPPEARAALAEMLGGVAVELERTGAYWALLSRFLAYHVLEGRSLRSLEFLTDVLQP